MSRRLIDSYGVPPSVFEKRFNLHKTAAARAANLEQGIVARAARVFPDNDAVYQDVDLRPFYSCVGERPQAVLPVEHASGQRILQTELAFQACLWPRIDQHPHASRWHAALEALDV